MKKIIYSLVIMIAAGSLFTSCIEQVEPLGIQDMRFAKAEYIRALKDLRAADAELVRAEAAHELARARYVDAMTANLNADTEYQQLLNEYQQLLNEARQDTNDFIAQQTANKIDSIKKRMELRELQHAKNMADAEQALALAQDSLRVALRNIALYSQSLTPDEQAALAAAVYMYETAFEVAAAQDIKVLKAQYKLDSLIAAAAVGDTVYDKDSKAYIGQVNKWKKDIEENEMKQAILAAILLAVPDSLDYEDLNAWKEQVDQLVADSTAAEYERYQTKIEMSQYYTANIHDGVDAFNDAVILFGAENDLFTSACTTPEDPSTWDNVPDSLKKKQKEFIAAGEPKQEEYHMEMDTIIVFPDLLKEDFNDVTTFENFSYLLNSYKVASPVSKADAPAGDIMIHKVKAPKNDTLRIQKADQSMKDFIIGANGDGYGAEVYTWEDEEGYEHEITADYGLKGALDVIKRVYKNQSDNEKDTSKIGPKMRAAEQKWASDRAILKAGIKSYQTFADSLSAFQTAYAAAQPTTLISKMKTLYAEVAKLDGATEVRANDSVAILTAVQEFAAAREAFFNDSKKYAKGENPNYFYFTYRQVGTEDVLDSVKFSAILTPTAPLTALGYQYAKSAPRHCVTDDMTNVSISAEKPRRAALTNILGQLLGADFKAAFNVVETTPIALNLGTSATTMGAAQVVYTLPGTTSYQFKADKKWSEATKLQSSPEGWEPAALTKAKRELCGAIGKYNAVYNAYWNESKPTSSSAIATITAWDTYMKNPTDANLKAALTANFTGFAYVETDGSKNNVGALKGKADFDPEVFKAFTYEEAPLVILDAAGTAIAPTEALTVVLKAVDPIWDPANAVATSAIFNGVAYSAYDNVAGTDFGKMMCLRYKYWKANHSEAFEQDTKVINDWISAVEHAFALDAQREGMPDTAAYNKAVKKYNRLTKQDADYKAFIKALHEFAGEDAEDQYDIVTLTEPTITSTTVFDNINDVLIDELVDVNVLGTYTGEWNEDLGGKQLELAKTLFPDYPEKILEWDAEMAYADDITEEYGILIDAAKAAYLAAAQVAGENVGDATSFDQLIENYKEANKNYRKRILDKIESLQEEIDQWEQNLAKWEVGAPAREIEIAEAANTLKVETARLQGYKEALSYAKANLDHLLEYIKSLDVNFVVPAVTIPGDDDED